MSKPTVAEYAVQRLAKLGITDCFGLPGDYAFPINDAIASHKSIEWRGCSNEQNASYAADGYARIRRAAMLNTTYAVGMAKGPAQKPCHGTYRNSPNDHRSIACGSAGGGNSAWGDGFLEHVSQDRKGPRSFAGVRNSNPPDLLGDSDMPPPGRTDQ